MEAHVKRLLYEFNIFRAFIIAALRISEQFRKFLEEKAKRAEGRLKEILSTFLSDLIYWLDVLRDELIPAMVILSKKIGIVVKSVEEGWIKDNAIIFKLLQVIRTIREKTRRLCLCALGKEQFERIEHLTEEFLRNPEKIQEREDELSELLSELEEIDKKLEESLEELDSRVMRKKKLFEKEINEEVV
jgi:hypothetical protein